MNEIDLRLKVAELDEKYLALYPDMKESRIIPGGYYPDGEFRYIMRFPNAPDINLKESDT